MTKTTQKPSYLEPSHVDLPQPEVIYEPPVEIGTEIRLGEDRSLEERTFRYERCDNGEMAELVTPAAQHFTVAGFQDVEHWTFNPDRVDFGHPDYEWKLTGSRRCFYAVVGEERPITDEDRIQDKLSDHGFHEWCSHQEDITDPEAHLRANVRQFIPGGNEWTGRKYFTIGEGDFHSALIGDTWVPVVRGSVRQQTVPVLGMHLEGARQTSLKGQKQVRGHKGVARSAGGQYASESKIKRRRWTTTLDVECLKVLEEICEETGQRRNEVVEELIREAYGG